VLKRRILAATLAAVVGLGGVAPAALATGDGGSTEPAPTVTHKSKKKKPKKAKKVRCNAGRGNGSEVVVNDGHCTNGDPGNSWAAGNQGGD
jgi:hypothetical protein